MHTFACLKNHKTRQLLERNEFSFVGFSCEISPIEKCHLPLCVSCICVYHIFVCIMYLCVSYICVYHVFVCIMYLCVSCICVYHVFVGIVYLCVSCICVYRVFECIVYLCVSCICVCRVFLSSVSYSLHPIIDSDRMLMGIHMFHSENALKLESPGP